jgi:hypothetical protein
MVGKRFGRLVVIEFLGINKSCKRVWKCKCDCGKITKVITSHLLNGHTRSCGCIRLENSIIATKKSNTKHGKCHTRIYRTWINMLARCYNKNEIHYKDYGARGIVVCNKWSEFINFYNWALDNGYKDTLTIDRINVNGNYEPSNCRWATNEQQNNNKRTNIFITYNGETKTLTQWERELKLTKGILRDRIVRYGWTIKRALTEKINNKVVK